MTVFTLLNMALIVVLLFIELHRPKASLGWLSIGILGLVLGIVALVMEHQP